MLLFCLKQLQLVFVSPVMNTQWFRWPACLLDHQAILFNNKQKAVIMLNADPNINMWRENQHSHQQVCQLWKKWKVKMFLLPIIFLKQNICEHWNQIKHVSLRGTDCTKQLKKDCTRHVYTTCGRLMEVFGEPARWTHPLLKSSRVILWNWYFCSAWA